MIKNNIKLRVADYKKDISSILEIQKSCYLKKYIESKSTFKNLMKIYNEGCIVALVNDKIGGYMFFHPSFNNQIQELNSSRIILTGKEDCLYLHDLAISPQFRGQGTSKRLYNELERKFQNSFYKSIYLVSVQKSKSFWRKIGFKVIKKLKYGEQDSYLMKRTNKMLKN